MTYINSGATTTNYSTDDRIRLGEWNNSNPLQYGLARVKCNNATGGIPADSVRLRIRNLQVIMHSTAITCTLIDSFLIKVYRIDSPWVEVNTTWNNLETSRPWATAGTGVGTDVNGPRKAWHNSTLRDSTRLITAWADNGICEGETKWLSQVNAQTAPFGSQDLYFYIDTAIANVWLTGGANNGMQLRVSAIADHATLTDGCFIDLYTDDATGTTNDPQLEVYYTPSGGLPQRRRKLIEYQIGQSSAELDDALSEPYSPKEEAACVY